MEFLTELLTRSRLAARSLTDGGTPNSVIDIMIALLCLVFFGLLMVSILVLLKRMRRQQQMRAEVLPRYHEVRRTGNHRALTIQTSRGRHSLLVFGKGQPMLANPHSPPHSPDNVPEIHITFPDEHDEHGRPKSGRVVVVRVGDATIGMEPLPDEQLPAYEKESKSQFYSIDMDRIGGLKEKEHSEYH